MDYLLIPETKNTPVYIVLEIISLQSIIRSQIVRQGILFYVSVEGVLSVWTMGTLLKIVPFNMCVKDVRGVNIDISICEADPLGKHNDSNNDKKGVTIRQIRIIVVLLATQGVKTRAYFCRPP